jgi:hypothetical protein
MRHVRAPAKCPCTTAHKAPTRPWRGLFEPNQEAFLRSILCLSTAVDCNGEFSPFLLTKSGKQTGSPPRKRYIASAVASMAESGHFRSERGRQHVSPCQLYPSKAEAESERSHLSRRLVAVDDAAGARFKPPNRSSILRYDGAANRDAVAIAGARCSEANSVSGEERTI